MSSTSNSEHRTLDERILRWLEQARAAYKKNDQRRADYCLYRMWTFQQQQARSKSTAIPPRPGSAKAFFKDDKPDDFLGPDDFPTPVPKRPYPGSDEGAVSLPLPRTDEIE